MSKISVKYLDFFLQKKIHESNYKLKNLQEGNGIDKNESLEKLLGSQNIYQCQSLVEKNVLKNPCFFHTQKSMKVFTNPRIYKQ